MRCARGTLSCKSPTTAPGATTFISRPNVGKEFVLTPLNSKLVAAMSRQEEDDLFRRYYDPTTSAKEKARLRDRAIMSVYRYAVREAAKCSGHVPMEDRVQAGMCGAMRAFDKFDPSRGNRFNTYVMWWIRLEVWTLVSDERTIVSKSGFRDSRNAELQKTVEVRYIDGAFASADDSHPEELMSDLAPADEAADLNLQREALYGALLSADITPAELTVLEGRWLSGQEKTLAALGVELGVSRERARQLEARAFKKLREALEA